LSFYELVDSLLNGTYVYYITICATISQRSISYCVVLVSDSPNDKAKQIKFDKLLNPNVLYLYTQTTVEVYLKEKQIKSIITINTFSMFFQFMLSLRRPNNNFIFLTMPLFVKIGNFFYYICTKKKYLYLLKDIQNTYSTHIVSILTFLQDYSL